MALTAGKNTKMKGRDLMVAPVAANSIIRAGAIIAANAAGFAAPGVTAANLTYLGRADEAVDATGLADGDKTVTIRRDQAFLFKNDGTDPVAQASLGQLCYIVDDEVVAATSGGGARSAAGIVVGIESSGVWVA